MSCKTCGRPAENGTPTHWLGCEDAKRPTHRVSSPKPVSQSTVDLAEAVQCEHDGCSEPKWSDGPRTKYCETHKDPKSREK